MKKKYLWVMALPFILASCDKAIATTNIESDNISNNVIDQSILSDYYQVTYNTDSHVSVYVYDSQDYTKNPTLASESVTRDSDGTVTNIDGQVNFLLVFDEGYELDSITVLDGTYKNIKTPSETLAYNVYRITKITSDTIVTIKSKELDPNNVVTSYVATFKLDEHVKVYVYDTQNYDVEPKETLTAKSRDSQTGEETILGGQINFKVVVDEGYEIRNVTATANTYSNIKLVDEVNNIYRITKLTANTDIKITTKLIGDTSLQTTYGSEIFSLSCDVENGSYSYSDNLLTITCNDSDTSIINLSGDYYGKILITGTNTSIAKINCNEFNMISDLDNVFVIEELDSASISFEEGTVNSINDLRTNILETSFSSSIYSACDLSIKGKGVLYIDSKCGNGIHTKDDLKIKNTTLNINVNDNALKGNDSVTIESGTLTLISRAGDGIKTSNSSLKSDGVTNKGTITITGGKIDIYSACDGIDSAYDVVITNDPIINIYTDKYSSYSEEVTSVSESKLYIKTTTKSYSYSIYFSNGTDGVWVNSSTYQTVGGSYYYEMSKPSGYTNFTIYVYNSQQSQENTESYYTSASGTINNAYDTLSYSTQRNTFSWTNYQTQQGPGGGMQQEGNRDKKDYSTKGIKADNLVYISGGDITIKSYDDGIHANNDNVLESGASALGSVNILGGNISVSSNDDGIHADTNLTISGGNINVITAYEGLEGNNITISGGTIDVYATDDGINASGNNASILVSGGSVNVLVSTGDTDAIDSNGTYTQTGGSVVSMNLSTQGMATALDTDSTVSLKGGVILCFGNIERTPTLSNVTSKNITGSFTAGTYKLYDSNNNLIIEFTLKTTYSKLYIAAESGEYKLVGNQTTTINL